MYKYIFPSVENNRAKLGNSDTEFELNRLARFYCINRRLEYMCTRNTRNTRYFTRS